MAAVLGLTSAAWSGHSWASTVVAPVTAIASSQSISKGKDFSIENTIDQSGLYLGYESGVTDFDSYWASKPEHTSKSDGNEWFSEKFKKSNRSKSSQTASQKRQNGSTKNRSSQNFSKSSTSSTSSTINASASTSIPLLSVIYDFKRPFNINGFILWNEEFSGIGKTELWSSINGTDYTLLSTITPEPSKFAKNGEVVPYLAQFFPFELTTMIFFKLLIYDCPGSPAIKSKSNSCGIGEVAFSAELGPVDNNPVVPLPAALPLLGSALAFFVWMGRRRKAI